MQFWKKMMDHTCRVYTVTAMLMLLLNLSEDAVLSAPAFLRVFGFALSFALADVLYISLQTRKFLRSMIHFVFVVVGAFVFLYLPTKETVQPMMALAMYLVFSVVYWILFFFIHIIGGRIRRLMELD